MSGTVPSWAFLPWGQRGASTSQGRGAVSSLDCCRSRGSVVAAPSSWDTWKTLEHQNTPKKTNKTFNFSINMHARLETDPLALTLTLLSIKPIIKSIHACSRGTLAHFSLNVIVSGLQVLSFGTKMIKIHSELSILYRQNKIMSGMSGLLRFVVLTISVGYLARFRMDFWHFCTKQKYVKPKNNNI